MPNIWTHILFCKEVVQDTQPALSYEGIEEKLLNLGAQGPDPFFYYQFWPWIKEETVQEVGNLLHTTQCGPFLMTLIQQATTSSKYVQAYTLGFITHHILDRNTHPYIHYRAGYEGNDHQRLEVIIDTLMMEKYENKATWKSPAYQAIDVGTSIPNEIVTVLDGAMKTHYPTIPFPSTTYIQKSYQDMKLAQRILYDPIGWKNAILKPIISAYSHRPVKDEKDYLNLQHTTWHHAATNEPSTASFIDLYNQSKKEANAIIPLVLQYWKEPDQATLHLLTKRIGNISYDTGKPTTDELTTVYSDPIV